MSENELSPAERLQAIRDRIAAKALERKKTEDEKILERQILEAEKLESLIDEHGQLGKDIRVLTTPCGSMVVVKSASYLHWKKFQSKGLENVNAQEDLVNACLVHPSKAVFHELRDKYPALVFQAAVEIGQMASVKQEELPGK